MERHEKTSYLKRASGSMQSLPTLVKTLPTYNPQPSPTSSLDSFDSGNGMVLKVDKKKERGFYVERNGSKGPPTKDGANPAVLDHDPPKLRSISAGPTTRHVSFGTLEETKKDMSNIYNPSAKRSASQGRVTGLHQRSDSNGLVEENHQRSSSSKSLRSIKSSLSLRRVSSNITDLALRGESFSPITSPVGCLVFNACLPKTPTDSVLRHRCYQRSEVASQDRGSYTVIRGRTREGALGVAWSSP